MSLDNFFKTSWPIESVYGYSAKEFEINNNNKIINKSIDEKRKKKLYENKENDILNLSNNIIQYIFSICEFKDKNYNFKYKNTTKNLILYVIREYLKKRSQFKNEIIYEDIQLTSLIILQIIAKLYEIGAPSYEELFLFCCRCYSIQDFHKTEQKVINCFKFNFDFRNYSIADQIEIYLLYLIPILNKKCLDKYKEIIYLVSELLYENFSYWYIYENKDLVAASILQASLVISIQRKNNSYLITFRLMMISQKTEIEILNCAKKILMFIFKLEERTYENIFE